MSLTTTPIPKLLGKIALPASTGIIFNTLYNVTDTYFAGLLSTQAIAALSMGFFVYFLLMGVGFGFSGAITALCGNALGKNKTFLAKIYAHKGFFLMSIVLGFIIMALGMTFDKDILQLLGKGADYEKLAHEYLFIMLLSSPFIFGSFSLNAILVSTGDAKSYRNMLIFGFFLNIFLNPLYMYGFGFIPALGFQGIALATLSVQIISVFYLFRKTHKTKMLQCKNLQLYLPEKRIYKDIFKQALPSCLNILSSSFSSIILLYFVAFYGEKAVAGYGIAYRVEQIALLPLFGISSAILTISANNYGAKKFDRVKEVLYLGVKIGFGICLIGVLLGLGFGKELLRLFDNDMDVVQNGFNYLKVAVFISFGYAIHFFSNSFLQGIKKPKIIFYIGLYRQLLALVPLFYLFVRILGYEKEYLWYSIFFAVYSSALFAVWYLKNILQNLSYK